MRFYLCFLLVSWILVSLCFGRAIPDARLPPMTMSSSTGYVPRITKQIASSTSPPFSGITPSPQELMLQKRALSAVGGWSYMGCYVDHALGANLMSFSSTTYATMNPAYCQSLGQNYLVGYVRVEATTSCYWDSVLHSGGLNTPIALLNCNAACPSPYQYSTCGGVNLMQVYSFTGVYMWSPSVIRWNQIGCYTDNVGSTRMFVSSIVTTSMGSSVCAGSAAARSYSMFNLEGSSTCWMGNMIANSASNTAIWTEFCSLTCSGNPADNCGGE